MKKIILLLTTFLLLLPYTVNAATINVPSEQPTIQAGINASSDGDIVLLADGTYTGAGNYNIDLGGKSITVKSSGGAENCIIDCQGNGRGFIVDNGETVIFEGLTIKNGNANGFYDDENGGAIHISSSKVTINNCIFEANQACNGGGAVYFSVSSVSFANCRFTENRAEDNLGGAIFSYTYIIHSPSSSSSFDSCTFTNNDAPYGGGAVALYFSSSSPFTNCTFTNNDGHGDGAVNIAYSSSSFTNCKFIDNKHGGYYGNMSTSSFTDCIFSGNQIAIDSRDNDFSFTECTFTDNSLILRPRTDSTSDKFTGKFTNCEFTRESSVDDRSLLICLVYTIKASLSFTECTFTGSGDSAVILNAIDNHNAAASFSNCTFTNNYTSRNGGAVNVNLFSTTFTDCTFDSNEAFYDGGAVFIPNKPFSFADCTFTGNCTSKGEGGAVFSSVESLSQSMSFNNCVFTDNTALAGGALCFHSQAYPGSVSYSVSNCKFSNNRATQPTSAILTGGGAVKMSDAGDDYYSFTDCMFTGNRSSGDGGAVWIDTCGFYPSNNSLFGNCIFTNNYTSEHGGAVYFDNGTPLTHNFPFLFNNCLFTGNRASFGGGIFAFHTADTKFNSCTFYNNQAEEQGGAIGCDLGQSAHTTDITLENCILWNDIAPEGTEIYENNLPLSITYSAIQDGYTGNGNIINNPMFVDADNDNLHLQCGSPCVDTGTADGAPANDLDGNPRPAGDGFDMGAYELQSSTTSITISSLTASPDNGAPPLTVNFTCIATDSASTIIAYDWLFGDGNHQTTSSGTTQHIYNVAGSFSASCTVRNSAGEESSQTVTVTVNNDDPVVIINGLLRSKGPVFLTSGKVIIVDGGCWIISDVGDDPDPIVYPDGMPTEDIILWVGVMHYDNKPPVTFSHKIHYRVYDNCELCHHQHPTGDWTCTRCHGYYISKSAGGYNVAELGHRFCKYCHRDRRDEGLSYGPITCIGCHVK